MQEGGYPLKFNPTNKEDSICADIDFLLFGNSSTLNTDYSLIDRTRNINISLDEVVSELFKADPNFMWDDTTNPDFPIAITTTSNDHVTIADETLVVHRVRIKVNNEYKTLTPVTRRELSDGDLNSSGTPDKYYKIDNAIFPIPVPASSIEYEIEFQRGANHFATSDTDKKPGFNPQFHQYLSVGASLRYALANGMREKVTFLQGEKERVRMMIQDHYSRRSPDDRTRLKLKKSNVSNYGL